MIIVDNALEKLERGGDLIKVGLIGAGTMGKAIANQIQNHTIGMQIVAIANRTLENAVEACNYAEIENYEVVESLILFENAIQKGVVSITSNPTLLCQSNQIDILIDATSSTEFGCEITLAAINNNKHIVTLNAELDATLGPILSETAKQSNVIYTSCDGDQPGALLNLYRFSKTIGITPLVLGNIKSLQDRYRTPLTQKSYAEEWKQNPIAVTSYADGTKMSFEQAIVANATGMSIAKRGMLGLQHDGHVDELTEIYNIDTLKKWGGIVDYVVGSKPAPGVYLIGTLEDEKQKHFLKLYKLGDGPLYCLYTPYHLCHFEVPISVARAVLFNDATVQPIAGPKVDVITVAKRDLNAGEKLDGTGGYMTYGLCETHENQIFHNLLPMGLSKNCIVKKDISKDTVITYSDIILPNDRLIDEKRRQQDAMFA